MGKWTENIENEKATYLGRSLRRITVETTPTIATDPGKTGENRPATASNPRIELRQHGSLGLLRNEYLVIDFSTMESGEPIRNIGFVQVNKELSLKMYSDMVTLQMMDTFFYEAQMQGRISFYATSFGEEAISIASAAALSEDDIILPQYREPGILLWRGFTLQEFANQCFGNKADYGKGRQMPIHYGSKKHNYLPQAVGVAYSLKMDKKNACAVAFTGNGGTSEGDFHAGLNFAAVLEAPVIFICRNNGWAISTPISEQFRSDGIVFKGKAYGIPSIRVDGTDALPFTLQFVLLAIWQLTLAYRVGHHSSSDDSTKYRPLDEIDYWKMYRNPVNKFRKWVETNGWWNETDEAKFRSSLKKQLLQAIQVAEKTDKPPLTELFRDVYDIPLSNLAEQEKQLRLTISKYPKDFPSDLSLRNQVDHL
ncbi:Dehydrogenase, E1 component [Corchorus capsularis]|uniref:Dehydrogenase, E1 component n=1 Tax=Corchorus capsularis TaxID=210143 RepID=A0A1R3G1X4_COCAP|nr:Dehydrogenase, E1 component [Corchorus capsularis]